MADVAQAQPGFIGEPIERKEDSSLLRGRGAFGDDLGVKAGTLSAAILRSPHAHAQITRIDVQAALEYPGVHAVLTGEDIQRWSRPFFAVVKQRMEHWVLAINRVRYVGEPIAVVVAKDRYIAEDALDLIEIDYEVLPAITTIEQALDPTRIKLHDELESNVVSDRAFAYGSQASSDSSLNKVNIHVQYPRNSCTPIECGVVLAEYLGKDDGYEVLSNFMGPFSLHAVMAAALNVPSNKLRHKVPKDSGGSFGVKQSVFPYVVLLCLAARKARAPVKWVEDRIEHLSAATSATARMTDLSAEVTPDGRIVALHWDQVDEVGAYLRAPEPATFYRMHGCLTGAYDIPRLTVRNRVVVCNKTPSGLVRGFGGPQVYFALERLVDRVAQVLGLDPLVVRQRNFVQASQFPFTAPAGAILDSGNYQALSEKVMKKVAELKLHNRARQARSEGRIYGIGMAAIVEPSISNMGYITTALTSEQRRKAGPKNGAIASATVSIDLLGMINVVIASAPAGQGHITVCAQVVADVFSLDPHDIVVNVEFDTNKDAWSVASGNYSSRFAGAVAGTVYLAACQLRDKLILIASKMWSCEPGEVLLSQGMIIQTGRPDSSVPLSRFAAQYHWAPALLPEGIGPGLRETAFWTPQTLYAPDDNDRVNTSAAYGFVFDVCAVEIDPSTGAVSIDQYITGHDAGVLLNPALADGQIRGAFAQGLGAALLEEFKYGVDGSFQSGTLADYLLPTACEVTDPVIVHQCTPSPFTPLGAKGLGEGNNMSTPVCVANAFVDALKAYRNGSEVNEDISLPLTPSRVLDLLGQDEPGPPEVSRQIVSPSQSDSESGLSLQANGEVTIEARPADVFSALIDPEILALVIPGCHSLDADGHNRYSAEVTVGVGVVKARYRVQVEFSDVRPPTYLRLTASGQSVVGVGAGEGSVTLEDLKNGNTKLKYDYRAKVSGKVAMVGSRMLEGAARIVINQFFVSFGRKVTGRVEEHRFPSLDILLRLVRRLLGFRNKP